MKVKVDLKKFNRMTRTIRAEAERLPVDAHKHFKSITPIRNGNARRRTRLSRNTIIADYGYAGRLDEGASRQAPDGMSDPTIEHIENTLIPASIRRINRG